MKKSNDSIFLNINKRKKTLAKRLSATLNQLSFSNILFADYYNI